MELTFSLILSSYCLLLVVLLVGWIIIRRQVMPLKGTSIPGISIVVAVRNETGNIQNLLRDLAAINYPAEKFEIVIVNDHSTDDTPDQLKRIVGAIQNARLIDLPEGAEGKKAALALGIKNARFEVIVTTDADCGFSKNWLRCISLHFENEETTMVIGAVKLVSSNSFFSRLQVTEFISLAGTTAAAIGLGHPVMCNGANLAFRKTAFENVKGYAGNLQIASGDDEFLMRKIHKQYPSGIRFLNYYEAVVSTFPQATIKDFFYQRLRWAGKWKHNNDLVARLLAVFIFVSQVAFVVLVVENILDPGYLIGLIAVKLFLEGVFLFWVGRFLERRFDMLAFIVLQFLYPVYVTVIGIFSLISSYHWKNRNYK